MTTNITLSAPSLVTSPLAVRRPASGLTPGTVPADLAGGAGGMPFQALPALPQAWALILLTSLVIGLLVGLLTFARTKGDWPTTLLAGLAAAGATILGVYQILGR